MSQYACSNYHEHSNFFLARVFPGGRASGSVCLANWPISWGENTLIPSLRVDPQKKFFYPQKSRQGLMAQSWARLMTFLIQMIMIMIMITKKFYVFLREYKVISLTAVLTLETVRKATVMTIFTCKNNILPKISLTRLL